MKLKGDLLGIPYDLRLSTIRNFKQRWWNSDDPRIIVPKAFGLGYDINLYQLKRRNPVLFNLFLAGLAAVAVSNLVGLTNKSPGEDVESESPEPSTK